MEVLDGISPARETQNSEEYWAKEEGTELIRHLITRREAYYRFIDRSRLFEQIIRLWRYYHGYFFENHARGSWDVELHVAGDDGEISLISVNHLRSLLHLLVTYVTQSPPGWDAVAKNADHRSLQQASLGNQVLDDTFDRKRVEIKMKRAVEHCLVLTAGYVLNVWDEGAGKVTNADTETNTLYHAGDVRYENPTIFDVVHDYTIRDWRDNQWFLVRRPMNKWDLIAKRPELKDQILQASLDNQSRATQHRLSRIYLESETYTDQVDTWHFWHLPSAAMPMGRYFVFLGGDTEFSDEDYDCDDRPVHRMTAAELLLTAFGTSPGFDLMGPQELLNAEFSTIATNHNNFGQLKVWLKTGNTINEADLDSGMSIVQCEDKPEVLNLLQTPAEIYETIKVIVQHMEYVSGVNSVARGQPEAALKSGTALAIIDQKALQFSEPLQASYYEIRADVGTSTLKLHQKHAMDPRVIAIAGIHGRSKLKEFWAKDLEAIERVKVQPGNSLMKNASGRWQFAELLVQNKLVQNREEILTFLDTGQLEPLTRADMAQLTTIHEENDAMENGDVVEAFQTDNHVLHIREHHSVLDSISKRSDPQLLLRVLGHIRAHTAMLMDPESQIYQAILGYSSPFPGIGGPMGAPGGEMGPGVPGDQKVIPGPGAPKPKESPAVAQAQGQAPPGMRPGAIDGMKNAVAQSGAA